MQRKSPASAAADAFFAKDQKRFSSTLTGLRLSDIHSAWSELNRHKSLSKSDAKRIIENRINATGITL